MDSLSWRGVLVHVFDFANSQPEVLAEGFEGVVAEELRDFDGAGSVLEHVGGAGPAESMGPDGRMNSPCLSVSEDDGPEGLIA